MEILHKTDLYFRLSPSCQYEWTILLQVFQEISRQNADGLHQFIQNTASGPVAGNNGYSHNNTLPWMWLSQFRPFLWPIQINIWGNSAAISKGLYHSKRTKRRLAGQTISHPGGTLTSRPGAILFFSSGYTSPFGGSCGPHCLRQINEKGMGIHILGSCLAKRIGYQDMPGHSPII